VETTSAKVRTFAARSRKLLREWRRRKWRMSSQSGNRVLAPPLRGARLRRVVLLLPRGARLAALGSAGPAVLARLAARCGCSARPDGRASETIAPASLPPARSSRQGAYAAPLGGLAAANSLASAPVRPARQSCLSLSQQPRGVSIGVLAILRSCVLANLRTADVLCG